MTIRHRTKRAWRPALLARSCLQPRARSPRISRLRLTEQSNHLRAFELPGPPERRTMVQIVLGPPIGPMGEQEADHLHVSILGRQVERRDPLTMSGAAEGGPPV